MTTHTDTTARTVPARPLGDLENRLLDEVSDKGWSLRAVSPEAGRWWPVEDVAPDPVRAAEWTGARLDTRSVVIVWHDELDGISFGVVRGAYRFAGQEETYEASPFPGAWVRVPRSQILSVRSTLAL